MRKTIVLLMALAFIGLSTDLSAQKKKKNKKGDTEQEAPKKKKNGLKDYSEVITDDAITDKGLITSHQVGDDFYFEIPSDLLEKIATGRCVGYKRTRYGKFQGNWKTFSNI